MKHFTNDADIFGFTFLVYFIAADIFTMEKTLFKIILLALNVYLLTNFQNFYGPF